MIERKIYNSWAFTENEGAKGSINREIYEELKRKYKFISRYPNQEVPKINEEDYDLIYERTAGYAHAVYEIKKNNTDLTTEELLLIFDGGNLCFGGRKLGYNKYRVSED